MLPQMNLLTVPLRMNSLQAVTASHLDCADPLPKEQDHQIVGVKQDIEQKTQETSYCLPGSVLWTRKVSQSDNC